MPGELSKPELATQVRVLHLRLKDKHAAALREKAYCVNQVGNFSNELSVKVFERERRFISSYEIDAYTKGCGKAGIPLHSQTVQAISAELVTRRRQFKKIKLRWRNGQLWLSGLDKPLSLWDSYGLAGHELGAGCISEGPAAAGTSTSRSRSSRSRIRKARWTWASIWA